MNTILEFLEKILKRIITFDGVELDELMWEWLNTIFGGAI